MIGTRCATTALILVASLASVAFAQQQPAKPAAAPQPQKPAATPQPAKPPAAPAKPAPTASGPGGAGGESPPTLPGQNRGWGAVNRPAGRQKGLLRARQAKDDEDGAGRAQARSVLRLRLPPPCR